MSDAYLTETLEAIEETIAHEEAKEILGKQLNRLLKTDDFNAVIGEALLTNYVKAATDIIINTLDPESPEVREALDKISFVNRLKEFFEDIQRDAIYAPGKIEQEQIFRKEQTAETSED
jgi:hypothetical protein